MALQLESYLASHTESCEKAECPCKIDHSKVEIHREIYQDHRTRILDIFILDTLREKRFGDPDDQMKLRLLELNFMLDEMGLGFQVLQSLHAKTAQK